MDESSLGNPGYSGGGGVVQDSFGNVLVGFPLAFGIRTNMEAEAMALLEGIKLCLE